MRTFDKIMLAAAAIAALALPAGPARADAPAVTLPHRAVDLTRVSRVLQVNTLSAAQSAAQSELKTLSSVIGTGDYRSLGFAHPTDLQDATLGTPIRTVFLPLDKLAAYQDGKDAVPYLEDSDGLIFPILVNGQVVSGIFMAKEGSGWDMVGLGQPNKVKALEATRTALAAANNVDKGTLFDVEVPALDLAFVGRAQNSKLKLTPIEDMPTFNLSANRELDAESVLHNLRPAAQNYEPVGVR